jgi:hypothetical protein
MKNRLSLLFIFLFNLSLSIYPLAAYADDSSEIFDTTSGTLINATASANAADFGKVIGNIAVNNTAKIIDIVNGTAIIKNKNNISRKALKGSVLQYGDLIYPSTGAIISVECSDRQRQVRSIQGLGDICPDLVGTRGNYGSWPTPGSTRPRVDVQGYFPQNSGTGQLTGAKTGN